MAKKPAKPVKIEAKPKEAADGVSLHSIEHPTPPNAVYDEGMDFNEDTIETIEIEADGPMTLSDVHAILADSYPGYVPTDPRGMSDGLLFTLPGGATLKVERKRVKACANMEELRAYVGSLT